MNKNYILVSRMSAFDVFDFLRNVFFRKRRGWNVINVRQTLFMNTYRVELEKRSEKFPYKKSKKYIQFVGYDTFFEFGNLNSDGKYNYLWLKFLLDKCINMPDSYLPTDDDDFKLEVIKLLRKENLVALSKCTFFKKVDASTYVRLKRENVNAELALGNKVYLRGVISNKDFFDGDEIINSSRIIKYDYPVAIDKTKRKYVLTMK